jgi:ribosomal protein S27AE
MGANTSRNLQKNRTTSTYHSDDSTSQNATRRPCPRCFAQAQHDVLNVHPKAKNEWPCFRMPLFNFPLISIHSPTLMSPSPQQSCLVCGSLLHDDDETVDGDHSLLYSYIPYMRPSMESFTTNSHLDYCITHDQLSTNWESDGGCQHSPRFSHYNSETKYVSLKALFLENRVATSITDESTRATDSIASITNSDQCQCCKANLLWNWRFCPNCGMYVAL